ncbi:MAG TPA: transposase [Cyanobacteria bacterium UBA11369]|nr:transposase [Cyanobacteria bacterium UBA11371]HBE32056.1 transposase [Cyanobacteria bacterium UBA11368]HBE49238.1 transposase [Cyanobacteria bacterium UBA11369]
MLTLTYGYKINPAPDQAAIIDHTLEVCRKVWNYALRERKDWINSRKCRVDACSLHSEYIIPVDAPYPSKSFQEKALTSAKKTNEELRSVNAQVLQQVLRKLDTAFEDMKRKGYGFPRFKKFGQMRSFVYPQMLKDPMGQGWIKLPQLGKVEVIMHRLIPSGFELKQARIVKKASGYYVMLSLQLDVNVPDTPPSGHPLGIDVGLEKFLATSDGELIKRPLFFNALARKLKLLQRCLKHKKNRSKNKAKLAKKIARVHEQIHDTRKDFHFKLAHHLCDQAGMIFAEQLNLKGMAKGMLGKHTLDAGWGQFLQLLSWVCWKRGVYFAKVDAAGTSQTCPECDAHVSKNLSVRVHECPECGYKTDRDVAAAQVVRNRGVWSRWTDGG